MTALGKSSALSEVTTSDESVFPIIRPRFALEFRTLSDHATLSIDDRNWAELQKPEIDPPDENLPNDAALPMADFLDSWGIYSDLEGESGIFPVLDNLDLPRGNPEETEPAHYLLPSSSRERSQLGLGRKPASPTNITSSATQIPSSHHSFNCYFSSNSTAFHHSLQPSEKATSQYSKNLKALSDQHAASSKLFFNQHSQSKASQIKTPYAEHSDSPKVLSVTSKRSNAVSFYTTIRPNNACQATQAGTPIDEKRASLKQSPAQKTLHTHTEQHSNPYYYRIPGSISEKKTNSAVNDDVPSAIQNPIIDFASNQKTVSNPLPSTNLNNAINPSTLISTHPSEQNPFNKGQSLSQLSSNDTSIFPNTEQQAYLSSKSQVFPNLTSQPKRFYLRPTQKTEITNPDSEKSVLPKETLQSKTALKGNFYKSPYKKGSIEADTFKVKNSRTFKPHKLSFLAKKLQFNSRNATSAELSIRPVSKSSIRLTTPKKNPNPSTFNPTPVLLQRKQYKLDPKKISVRLKTSRFNQAQRRLQQHTQSQAPLSEMNQLLQNLPAQEQRFPLNVKEHNSFQPAFEKPEAVIKSELTSPPQDPHLLNRDLSLFNNPEILTTTLNLGSLFPVFQSQSSLKQQSTLSSLPQEDTTLNEAFLASPKAFRLDFPRKQFQSFKPSLTLNMASGIPSGVFSRKIPSFQAVIPVKKKAFSPTQAKGIKVNWSLSQKRKPIPFLDSDESARSHNINQRIRIVSLASFLPDTPHRFYSHPSTMSPSFVKCYRLDGKRLILPCIVAQVSVQEPSNEHVESRSEFNLSSRSNRLPPASSLSKGVSPKEDSVLFPVLENPKSMNLERMPASTPEGILPLDYQQSIKTEIPLSQNSLTRKAEFFQEKNSTSLAHKNSGQLISQSTLFPEKTTRFQSRVIKPSIKESPFKTSENKAEKATLHSKFSTPMRALKKESTFSSNSKSIPAEFNLVKRQNSIQSALSKNKTHVSNSTQNLQQHTVGFPKSSPLKRHLPNIVTPSSSEKSHWQNPEILLPAALNYTDSLPSAAINPLFENEPTTIRIHIGKVRIETRQPDIKPLKRSARPALSMSLKSYLSHRKEETL